MKKIVYFIFTFSFLACVSNQPEARKPVSYSSGSFLKESAAKNKKIVEEEKKAILQRIAEDTLSTYQNSPNGFWYTYQQKSTTKNNVLPEKGDLVVFEYDLLALDGDTLYSKKEIGVREYYIDEEKIFTGLRQALKLMHEGETLTFLFPSYKAFGYYGDLERIGSNVPLQSTITLKSIKKNQKSIN